MLKVGTTFTRADFPSCPVTIKEIETHKVVDKKKIKLDREVYIVGYEKWITKTETRYTETRMYKEDILRQINFELWKLKQ